MKKLSVIIGLLCFLTINILAQQKETTQSSYFFGQKIPGTTAEKFLPDILGTAKYPHGQLLFSKDGTTAYWATSQNMKSTIYNLRYNGETPAKPEKAQFALEPGGNGPSLSSDGKRIFFSTEIPSSSKGNRRTAICYTDWDGNKWGKPNVIESTDDTLMTKGQVSVAKSGNIYLSGRVYSERTPSIFVCRKDGDKYLAPEKIKGQLAEAGLITDPWIDPDEKFMLFSVQPEQGPFMITDIGISFRQADGTWGKPVKLNNSVNTKYFERFPSLSPDGKYLFFIRAENERFVGEGSYYYWISASIIEELMPKK